MHLELATYDHYFAIQDMALKFAKHSPYGEMEIDEAKVADLITGHIEDPTNKVLILAMDGEKPVGLLAGVSSEILFSRKKIASELMWWMEPDYRNSRIGFELVAAYEYWAKRNGCSVIQMSTVETEQTDRIAKVYARKGYRLVERSFIKEIH